MVIAVSDVLNGVVIVRLQAESGGFYLVVDKANEFCVKLTSADCSVLCRCARGSSSRRTNTEPVSVPALSTKRRTHSWASWPSATTAVWPTRSPRHGNALPTSRRVLESTRAGCRRQTLREGRERRARGRRRTKKNKQRWKRRRD